VILDSPAISPQTLANAQRIAQGFSIQVRVIRRISDRSLREERLKERVRLASQPAYPDEPAMDEAARYARMPEEMFAVDMAHPPQDLLPAAIAHVRREG
jgi:hypothetical protein